MKSKKSRPSFTELSHLVPIHPFFFAIYPILGLLAVNVSQVYTRDISKSVLIALIAVTLIILAFRLLSRSWQLGGLLASLLVAWFFTYGHLYNLVKNLTLFGVVVGRHRYLLLVWTGLILSIAFWLIKRFRAHANLTFSLNLIAMILVCIPIAQVSLYHLRAQAALKASQLVPSQALISWTQQAPPPDIYYIVLDGYARSDTLQALEGIDNSEFIGRLQQMGFYVAACSQSNYTRTLLSLSSTFNLDYVQNLNPQLTPSQSTEWLYPYLKHSLVRQQLEQLGYQTIVFENPWESMVWDDADIVYRYGGSLLLSPFEYLILDTTVTRVYLDSQQARSNQIAHYANYVDTLYALDRLQDVPSIPGPKLVFAHLVVPHAPYVFGADGQYIDIQPYDTVNNLYTDEDHRRGYTSAVAYIDKRMLEILPRLIQSSKTPPIIILAGDHGTGPSSTVTQNLEAFYLPGSAPTFYSTITPVNIFRLLFDAYFNGNFGLLPDHSYFSAQGQYFNFQEIPNGCTAP
jgi:uncharacterized membrane protein